MPNFPLKFQSATFGAIDDFEIVYYQWKGFLRSERLTEGFRIVLYFVYIVRQYYTKGLVAGFDDFFFIIFDILQAVKIL